MEFRNPNFGEVKGVRFMFHDERGNHYAGIHKNRIVLIAIPSRLTGYSMQSLYDNLQNPNEELLAHMNDMRNWK